MDVQNHGVIVLLDKLVIHIKIKYSWVVRIKAKGVNLDKAFVVIDLHKAKMK